MRCDKCGLVHVTGQVVSNKEKYEVWCKHCIEELKNEIEHNQIARDQNEIEQEIRRLLDE